LGFGVSAVKRREFITLLGGAVAWPLVASAQKSTIPVVGVLNGRSAHDSAWIVTAFHRGLRDTGFVENQNVAIEYRWAEYHQEQLNAFAADLVRREVTVIAALSYSPTVLAAKAATTTIPIVFAVGSDPIGTGLVSSINRPGGNVTGVSFFATELGTKRLEMLRELIPNATTIAVLVDPNTPASETERATVEAAAQAVGQRTEVFSASTGSEIDRAFLAIEQRRPDALLVTGDPFFFAARNHLVTLAARHAIPTMYWAREYVDGGGLISYGASQTDAFHQAGVYTGRVLKGEKVGDLPIMLPTRFEMVLNLKTAKAPGLTVPPTLIARADEVIE
jgi:putative tryptophan/tyrosine transport system substrate-binding protein